MKASECIEFLQQMLPRLRLRWPGFRKVRGQVCKRVRHRLQELALADVAAYRAYLESHPAEWEVLDGMCHITISRFYRDKGVFDFLARQVLPEIARMVLESGEKTLRCWSAGCASGEEPYTLALLWQLYLKPRFPDLAMRIVATDADAAMLKRAELACYRHGSVDDLPEDCLTQGFVRVEDEYCLRPVYRDEVEFLKQDLRCAVPDGTFHLVLCRNLAFTYFDDATQSEVLRRIHDKLRPDGVLVIGSHESLPQGASGFLAWSGKQGVYRRMDRGEGCGGKMR